eukprot:Gb_12767 [translate_table: standard]
MAKEKQSHVLVFPFPAQGHMIPLLDLTYTLASRGLSITVLTTTHNESRLQPLLDRAASNALHIQPLIFPLPPTQGLPPGCQNTELIPGHLIPLFIYSLRVLGHPLEEWFLQQQQVSDGYGLGPPVCIISDFFLGWTQETAAKLGIPRIVFHPSGAFAVSVMYSLWAHMPQQGVESDDAPVPIPHFPLPLTFPKSHLSRLVRIYKSSDPVSEFIRHTMLLNVKSWGTLNNTFYELESIFIDHLQRVSGRPVWSVGPLLPPALFRKEQRKEIIERGKPTSINESLCLQWLDCQKQRSVLYICFGSQVFLSNKQIEEIAAGLEASQWSFIWALKDSPTDLHGGEYGVLPEGFEEKMKDKGLIIRGWAPQLPILSHPSVGGFLTHCGWNSTLESVALGVPLITWPMTADQFFNAFLVVEYLKVGVRLCEGATAVNNVREHLKTAIKRVLGREGEEMKRALELRKSARIAVQEGGSSHRDLEAFVAEIQKPKQIS